MKKNYHFLAYLPNPLLDRLIGYPLLAIAYLRLTIEALEQSVKYVQS